MTTKTTTGRKTNRPRQQLLAESGRVLPTDPGQVSMRHRKLTESGTMLRSLLARRTRFSQLLTCGLVLAMASVATANEPLTLRVLCYNIQYGRGMDGVYDIPRLAEVIKATQPDLVALQEVDVMVARSGRVHQARELGKLTGLQALYGPTQHYQGGLFGNAVLSRFPITHVEIQPLPYTEATPERTTYPRAAISVMVTLPDGRPLQFISTHFQHNVEEDRVAQAKALNEQFANGDILTILAGDMNATPEAEPIQILESAWQPVLDEARAPTAPADKPRVRIDYIFYRGTGIKVVETHVLPESLASDHRPVFAVLELPPASN